ncbi:hypothetical protein MACK_002092 [Theileria orientalis]|uniref:Uncharacterized protein n=1 Tax=Theileria orientalis TaxID=68886 RepID=A0A976MDP1_THEOR|nr:hypothetical protein MACK_002092 [Theileria orientalis]
MDRLDDRFLYTTVSAVLETLGDEQNVRVALISPHTARKLVKESVDSEEGGILESLTDSILVDLPFRKLLYESRKVQRLYYELDQKSTDLYGKSNMPTNSLMLIDPIRLANNLNMDMNQTQRALYMRCFSPRIWLIFLRLVSLGVGSKMRELYCSNKKKSMSDSFITDLEGFQLGLVEMVIQVTTVDLRLHSPLDIECKILSGCANIIALSRKLKDSWDGSLDGMPLLSQLIPDLVRCVSHIDKILVEKGPCPEFLQPTMLDKASIDDSPSTLRESRRNCLNVLNAGITRQFRLGDSGLNESDPYDDGKTPMWYCDDEQNDLGCRSGSNTLSLLQGLSRSLVSVATKSATLISLMKLKVLEDRQREFETPGSFSFINNEVLRTGFVSSKLDENEAVPLLILSHCLGAYSLREWVMRFLVDVKFDLISHFLEDADLSVNSYGIRESAYFRTAGQTTPKLGDYFTLVPSELKKYMKQLAKAF